MIIFIWLWICSAWSTVIYPDTIVTRYPEQYPNWIISAYGTPSQRYWLPYDEQAPFQGTNGACQEQCYLAACPGWSWVPPQKELALEYGDDALQNIVGTCRLYSPSNTHFYLYSYGQKWSHDLVIGDGGTCPRNTTQHVGFAGKSNRGKYTYKKTLFPGIADFCLLRGHVTCGCQAMAIELQDAKRFVLINDTEIGTDPFWCSTVFNGCGAQWPLYEKTGESVEYATKQMGEDWNLLCYVWEPHNC